MQVKVVATFIGRRLFDIELPKSPYGHRVMDECYISGELYSDELYRGANSPGWKLEEIARWAQPWLEYLRTCLHSDGSGPALLPPEFLDCVPFNLVRRADGTLAPFDLEHIAEEPGPHGRRFSGASSGPS